MTWQGGLCAFGSSCTGAPRSLAQPFATKERYGCGIPPAQPFATKERYGCGVPLAGIAGARPTAYCYRSQGSVFQKVKF